VTVIAGQGLGSGFVISGGGEVATNAHVVTTGTGASIRRASHVYVKFADGNEVPAQIVGYDPNADVALLRSAAPRTCASARRSQRSARRSARSSRCPWVSSPRRSARSIR